ncbi:MAG: hypothetical protein ACQETH_08015 [Candidatus Rifleibacteriota bacterium]
MKANRSEKKNFRKSRQDYLEYDDFPRKSKMKKPKRGKKQFFYACEEDYDEIYNGKFN